MQTVLEVRELHKSFRASVFGRRVQALRGVSFQVHEGECFGYLGPNGAGKTTTLKIVTGQMRAGEGEVRLLGAPAGDAATRRALGYLPENPYFHEHLTPVEGLDLFGRLSGVSPAEIRRRTPALIERVGLTQAQDRRVRNFSKGMRQRYGLAAALIAEPRVLILDEPLSGLDPSGRQLVKEILREQRREGRTVILSSHVLADVQEICDRVVVLNQGKVMREGPIQSLLDQDARAFELTVSGVSESLRGRLAGRALRSFESDGRLHLTLAGAETGPELATEVVRAGGRVHSLVPERETLEEWFVRMTRDAVEPVAGVPAPTEPVAEPTPRAEEVSA